MEMQGLFENHRRRIVVALDQQRHYGQANTAQNQKDNRGEKLMNLQIIILMIFKISKHWIYLNASQAAIGLFLLFFLFVVMYQDYYFSMNILMAKEVCYVDIRKGIPEVFLWLANQIYLK